MKMDAIVEKFSIKTSVACMDVIKEINFSCTF